jgi:Na+/proline symporter
VQLSSLDLIIICAFFAMTLLIGIYASRKGNATAKDFFLSGREMPWWLLGVSMVATTFSADTPNLVTDIIRTNGVAGNWVWWAFLLTGMATVFIYAKLWRRSGITTDLEFYELRYSGGEAKFLRIFRAVYLGVFFNVMIMATVLLAGIKIGGVMLGLSPIQTVAIVSIVTVSYAMIGGLRGVILTDFFQFFLSMIGMVGAAIYILGLPEIGGLAKLVSHPQVAGKIDLFPDFSDLNVAIPLFFIPIAVQWWSAWYPGAEPGGGGYVAQRMLSARDEKDAVKATLFFNAAHYALRPWPWILIALASLILFPDLASLKESFPHIDDSILGQDLAFPAMLTVLPAGLVGLVIAALISALMSTISTHLNWGASYMVNDVHLRFFRGPLSGTTLTSERKPENKSGINPVMLGRIWTLILMILAAVFALFLTNALQAFNILLQIGAGTGLLFLLRWFWWRINAYSEITAMIVSFMVAIYFELLYQGNMEAYMKMCLGVAITTMAWVAVTLITRPTDMVQLQTFFSKIRPHAGGWQPVVQRMDALETSSTDGSFARELLMLFLGCVMIYAALFAMGYLLYGQFDFALIALTCFVVGFVGLRQLWE